MITDAIVNLLASILGGLLSAIPNVGPEISSASTGNAAQMLGSGLAVADGLVPITLALSMILSALAFELVVLGIRLALWAYRLIPGKFT